MYIFITQQFGKCSTCNDDGSPCEPDIVDTIAGSRWLPSWLKEHNNTCMRRHIRVNCETLKCFSTVFYSTANYFNFNQSLNFFTHHRNSGKVN